MYDLDLLDKLQGEAHISTMQEYLYIANLRAAYPSMAEALRRLNELATGFANPAERRENEMSIEMDSPVTALEKADALTNLVEQMYMAHKIRNEYKFEEAYNKAGDIGFDLLQMLSGEGGEG